MDSFAWWSSASSRRAMFGPPGGAMVATDQHVHAGVFAQQLAGGYVPLEDIKMIQVHGRKIDEHIRGADLVVGEIARDPLDQVRFAEEGDQLTHWE